MNKGRMTIRDLADLAGVSVATVSRALAGSPAVKPETRRQILELAEKHNYEINTVARNLSMRSTQTIAVLIDDIANPFFSQVVKGVENALEGSGYSMIIASSNWDGEREEALVRTMVRNRVAGIIIAPTGADSAAVNLLRRQGIPFVMANCRGRDGESWICTDNFRGGYLGAAHLLARGVERLAYLVGFPHQTTEDRVRGILSAVSDSGRTGVEMHECPDVRTSEEGYEKAAAIIARYGLNRERSGVFALNDVVASGFLKAVTELKIPVPQNISLVGFDDIFFAGMFRYPLTTVSQPKEEMGKRAVEALFEIMADPAAVGRGTLLQPQLVVRET